VHGQWWLGACALQGAWWNRQAVFHLKTTSAALATPLPLSASLDDDWPARGGESMTGGRGRPWQSGDIYALNLASSYHLPQLEKRQQWWRLEPLWWSAPPPLWLTPQMLPHSHTTGPAAEIGKTMMEAVRAINKPLL
jgi:hypothetical protein